MKPFIVLALVSLLGCAQAPAQAPVTSQAAAQRHAEGLALGRGGNEKAALA